MQHVAPHSYSWRILCRTFTALRRLALSLVESRVERKRLELYDLTDSIYSDRRWAEEVDLPWLSPSKAVDRMGKPLLG